MEKHIFKTDKRSLRTRQQIKMALIVLLKTKSPNNITVSEITALANVNRNSFYTHYKAISDVMSDIYESILSMITDVLTKFTYVEIVDDPYPFMKEITLLITENAAFSEYVMFSKDSGKLVQDLIDAFTDSFYEKYLVERKDGNPNVPYLINFIVGGTIEFIYRWYKSGRDVPIENLVKNVSYMIKDGVFAARSVKREEKNKII